MKFILTVLSFTAVIYTAHSLCNTCSAVNGAACVANDQFQICVNGLPATATYQCPSGTICSATSEICSPTGSVQPSCSRCGTCSTDKSFACTGYRTFALCYGTDVPSTVNMECSSTTVCNIDSTQICVNPAAGIGGTCPSVTTTTTTTAAPTTTPNPATNPQVYCAYVAAVGRYDIPTDTTCKRYVYCTLVSGAWIGNIYECAGSTLFNPTTEMCSTTRPSRCP